MRRIGLVLAATVMLLAALLVVAPHLTREHGPRGHQAARLTAPTLRELAGGLTIGCGYDGTVSAPEVCRGGQVVGVWIDDTTPHIRYWIARAAAKYAHGLVLIGVAPGQAGTRYGPRPPVVNCYEAYPYGEGVPVSEWFPLARYACYIAQWLYPGVKGRSPPSSQQRTRLLERVRQQHPRYIFLF